MRNFWLRKDNRPNLVLSPMAGYTDSAFRQICKEFGANILMTELISADGIFHNKNLKSQISNLKSTPQNKKNIFLRQDKTLALMQFEKVERPIVVQLFGKYPEKFAFAAKWVAENIKPDGIDINMGCPARKVVGSDHGAALLKNHALAVEIVQAVKEQIKIPLSVKTRLGWENDDEILKFAPELVKAGIDAIIIHGRTYKDGFKNISRWKNIYEVKSQITNHKSQSKCEVAVIGNGDIKSYEEAMEKSESAGVKLDGVAIGRAAFGKPNIFQDIITKKQGTNIKELILKHAKLSYQTKGDHGIIEFRKHLLAYTKGLPNAKKLRTEAVEIESVRDVERIVGELI